MKDRCRSRDRLWLAIGTAVVLLIAITHIRVANLAETSDASRVLTEAHSTQWFRDAKFGMFIHWGPYSLASVEASWPIMRPDNWAISEQEYVNLYKRFNPTQFDPAAWVRLAQEAG